MTVKVHEGNFQLAQHILFGLSWYPTHATIHIDERHTQTFSGDVDEHVPAVFYQWVYTNLHGADHRYHDPSNAFGQRERCGDSFVEGADGASANLLHDVADDGRTIIANERERDCPIRATEARPIVFQGPQHINFGFLFDTFVNVSRVRSDATIENTAARTLKEQPCTTYSLTTGVATGAAIAQTKR